MDSWLVSELYLMKNFSPTFFIKFIGLIFLLIILSTLIYVSYNLLNIPKNTDIEVNVVSIVNKDIVFSNQTDTGFTVFWKTSQPSIGKIQISKTISEISSGKLILDLRDELLDNPIKRSLHYINITNLEPNTEYYFQIISDEQKDTNNSNYYKSKTLNKLNSIDNETNNLKISLPSSFETGFIFLHSYDGSKTSSVVSEIVSIPSILVNLNDLKNLESGTNFYKNDLPLQVFAISEGNLSYKVELDGIKENVNITEANITNLSYNPKETLVLKNPAQPEREVEIDEEKPPVITPQPVDDIPEETTNTVEQPQQPTVLPQTITTNNTPQTPKTSIKMGFSEIGLITLSILCLLIGVSIIRKKKVE